MYVSFLDVLTCQTIPFIFIHLCVTHFYTGSVSAQQYSTAWIIDAESNTKTWRHLLRLQNYAAAKVCSLWPNAAGLKGKTKVWESLCLRRKDFSCSSCGSYLFSCDGTGSAQVGSKRAVRLTLPFSSSWSSVRHLASTPCRDTWYLKVRERTFRNAHRVARVTLSRMLMELFNYAEFERWNDTVGFYFIGRL